jgi:LPS O-antigen subunit length determinant protein (WzzB/FepE family)
MRRALIRLYPAAWRARYGAEFEALLFDLPAGWRGNLDVFKGAVAMRLKYESWRGIVLGLMLAGVLSGLLGSYLIPTQWRSTAVLQITARRMGDPGLNEVIQQIQSQVTSRQSLRNLIRDPRLDLYPVERRSQPLEDVEDEMRANVRFQIVPAAKRNGAQIFTITFTYSDPKKAQDTVNGLITRFIAESIGIPAGFYLETLDPPSLPRQPYAPKRSAFMIAGGVGGLVVAAFVILSRRRRTGAAGQGLEPA